MVKHSAHHTCILLDRPCYYHHEWCWVQVLPVFEYFIFSSLKSNRSLSVTSFLQRSRWDGSTFQLICKHHLQSATSRVGLRRQRSNFSASLPRRDGNRCGELFHSSLGLILLLMFPSSHNQRRLTHYYALQIAPPASRKPQDVAIKFSGQKALLPSGLSPCPSPVQKTEDRGSRG